MNKEHQVENEFDVIIIGAGPAGSVCAIRLKQLNPSLRVCLVDKKKFPREKACGDGLGPGVHKIIHDLGLTSIFANSEPIERLAISSATGIELNAALPMMGEIKPLGFVIPRGQFDNDLVREAGHLDVTILEEFEITGFHDKGNFLSEVYLKNKSGQRILQTKLLIGADGARSKVRRLLHIPYNSDKHTGIATRYYCEMEGYNEISLRLDFLKEINPGYGWLFPISKTCANIGVGIDVSKFKKRNLDADKMFASYLNYLSVKLKIKVMKDTKLSYMLPYGSQMPSLINGKNKILIGDAASMINPFTGEGIYYGMYAGKSLAEFIQGKLNNEKQLSISLEAFETSFLKKFKKHFKVNSTTKYLMNTFFSNLAIRACRKDPQILKEGLEVMMGDRKNFNPLKILKIFFFTPFSKYVIR